MEKGGRGPKRTPRTGLSKSGSGSKADTTQRRRRPQPPGPCQGRSGYRQVPPSLASWLHLSMKAWAMEQLFLKQGTLVTPRWARGRPEGRMPRVTSTPRKPSSAVDPGVPQSKKWAKVHPHNCSSPPRAQPSEPSPPQVGPTCVLGARQAPLFLTLTKAVLVLLSEDTPPPQGR